MARIIPDWSTDEEVDQNIKGPGSVAERHLYKLMRDGLPDDWTILYDRTFSAGRQSAQIDFLVFVPGKGVCNVDAKGTGYQQRNGVVSLNPADKDVFNEALAAIHVFDKWVKERVSNGDSWGAFSRLVVFSESDFPDPVTDGNHCLEAKDLLLPNGTESAKAIQDKIESLLDDYNWCFRSFVGWEKPILDKLTPSQKPIERPDDFTKMEKLSRRGLDQEQQGISWTIETEKYVHVCGGAGTGKTIIAISSAVEFAKQGKRVLYVCFNKALAEQCRVECPKADSLGIVISHFHGLGEALGAGNCFVPGPGGKLDRPKTLQRMQALPETMRRKNVRKFDILLVDEAQDLLNEEILLLLSLVRRDRHVAVFSDDNQKLFNKDWSLDQNMFDKPPTCCHLGKNYRNTDKILDHFRPLTEEKTIPMIREKGNFSTKKVVEIEEDGAQKTIERLLSEGRRPRDIAVLSDRVELLERFKSAIADGMSKPIPIRRYNEDAKGNRLSWKEGRKVLENWRNDKCILKETIQSFKGLEANCVVLLLAENSHDSKENTMNRYVGESRAKYELYIVSGKKTEKTIEPCMVAPVSGTDKPERDKEQRQPNEQTKSNVQLLLVSDIHNSGTEGMDPTGCDAAVVAGDFKFHGWSSCDPEWKHAVNDDPFFQWCNAHSDLPVFLVPGNHDLVTGRCPEWLVWPKNVIRLDESGTIDFKDVRRDEDGTVVFKGLRLWGSPWSIKYHDDGVFSGTEDDLKRELGKAPDHLDVLVIHGPPRLEDGEGGSDARDGEHVGGRSAREVILEKRHLTL